jgi:transposase
LTRTGNTHARGLLIEAAWHHRRPYRPGVVMRRRWQAASPGARARGQAANRRLHARWLHFDQRKKHPVVANAAIARELAGWCGWQGVLIPNMRYSFLHGGVSMQRFSDIGSERHLSTQ